MQLVWLLISAAVVAFLLPSYGVFGQPCPEFCSCNGTSRVIVICERQEFDSVPALQFNYITNTTTLTLGVNAITSLPRYAFFHLTALRRLYLYQNSISDIHVEAFQGLRHLELLSLAANQISRLPVLLFDELPQLQHLFLHGNQLTTEDISPEMLQPLSSSLQLITLQNNNISYLEPRMFSSLTHLTSLGLGENPITEIENGVFQGLSALQVLDMPSCQIETIGENAFRNLTELRKLDLSNNRLTSISRLLFVDLINLREIHLQFNRIVTIDDGSFFRLSHLESLFVQANGLTEIRPGMFSGLFALRLLWLDRNRIETIQTDTFQDLGNLIELYMHNNRLTSLSFCQFKGASLLQILVLQYNQISCIADSAFCCLPYLSRLYLGANDISLITPRMLSCMTQLTRLSMYGNRISFVADGSFNSLTALRDLIWDYPRGTEPSASAISNNLACDCNAVYLKGFIEQSPDVINSMTCASPTVLRTRVLSSVEESSLNCTEDVSVRIVIDDYKSPTAFRQPPSPDYPAAVETIVVPRGDDLHLVARASPIGVTFWTRAGRALVAHDCGMVTPNGNLALISMTEALEGLYTLVVQSASGATAQSAFITVGEAPRIIVPPQDIELQHPGENVMLTCVVTGKPTPTTYWMKNGRRLDVSRVTPSTPYNVQAQRFVATNGSLHILQTEYSDGGLYSCVAENGIGRAVQREAELFFRRATACSPSCRNSGTCVTTKIHACLCTSEFVGEVCERPRPGCDMLGGECVSGGGSGEAVPRENAIPVEENETAEDSSSIERDGRPAGSQVEATAQSPTTPSA